MVAGWVGTHNHRSCNGSQGLILLAPSLRSKTGPGKPRARNGGANVNYPGRPPGPAGATQDALPLVVDRVARQLVVPEARHDVFVSVHNLDGGVSVTAEAGREA